MIVHNVYTFFQENTDGGDEEKADVASDLSHLNQTIPWVQG